MGDAAETTVQPPSRTGQRVMALTAGNVVSALVLLVMDALLARILPLSEYGTYRQTRLIHSFALPLFSAAIPLSVLYFLPRCTSDEEKRNFLGQTMAMLFWLGLALGGALLLGADLLAEMLGNARLAPSIRLISLFAFTEMVVSFLSPAFIAYERLKPLLAYLLLRALMLTAVSVLFGWVLQSAYGAVLGLGLASVLSCGLGIFLLQQTTSFSLRFTFELAAARLQLAYALPFGAAAAVGRWALQVDQWVVSMLFPASLYGVYVVGATEIPFVTNFQQASAQVLLPKLSRLLQEGKLAECAELWRKAFCHSFTYFAGAFWGLQLVADDLIPLIFSEAFRGSVPVFRIYLCFVLLRSTSFGLLLRAGGRGSVDLRGTLLFLGLNALLCPLAAWSLGLLGPPLAVVLAAVCLVAYFLVQSHRLLGVSMLHVFPWAALGRRFFAAALVGALVWGGGYFVLADLHPLLRMLAVSCAFGSLFLVMVRLLFPRDFQVLSSSIF